MNVGGMSMFPFGGSHDKHDGDIGLFELPARHKLLDAKRATKRDKELSQLCDKLDDLVALSGTLTRLMLQYVEKHLPNSDIDETKEYEKFKGIISLDTFQLLKQVMINHLQRTESASQLVDILNNTPVEEGKKADIIHVALEIALNQNDYSSPEKVDTSMLLPPLSMTPDEFADANKRYESILNRVENFISSNNHTEQEKCSFLAQMMAPSRRSRTAKTMILVRAWACKEKANLTMPHHDQEFSDFLRRMEASIDDQIAALRTGEPDSPPTSVVNASPDIEEIHNGMMEARLRRLLANDEENNGGNE